MHNIRVMDINGSGKRNPRRGEDSRTVVCILSGSPVCVELVQYSQQRVGDYRDLMDTSTRQAGKLSSSNCSSTIYDNVVSALCNAQTHIAPCFERVTIKIHPKM